MFKFEKSNLCAWLVAEHLRKSDVSMQFLYSLHGLSYLLDTLPSSSASYFSFSHVAHQSIININAMHTDCGVPIIVQTDYTHAAAYSTD